jgi:hypothetical protein
MDKKKGKKEGKHKGEQEKQGTKGEERSKSIILERSGIKKKRG